MKSNPCFERFAYFALGLILWWTIPPPAAAQAVEGWLNWRGPFQNGASTETDLPDRWTPGGENHLWTYDIKGRGTPVIAGDRVYTLGYQGTGPDLREWLLCLDADSGELIWKHGFNDFLSDIIYSRYSIGSPTVDPETGNVYAMSTAGIFACFTRKGKPVWEHSMMEEFGRLSFPNGRTGSPIIDDELVIVHGITSHWGKDGPARDRFYAFEKRTGKPVWRSTPGVGPKDSSFSTPVLDWQNGKRVLYAGTGCGNVVCLNAWTGDPLWRFQLSHGGINSSPVKFGENYLIAIQGKENVDDSTTGRMVSLQLVKEPAGGEKGPVVLDHSAEVWRNELGIFTSSPVIVEDRIYQTIHTGDLCCVDANNGEILWKEKLGPTQLHASPLYADGKLYVPLLDGKFYILRPSDEGAEILSEVNFEEKLYGAPSVWNGKVYLHTDKALHCFGSREPGKNLPKPPNPFEPTELRPTKLQAIPAEVLMRPGEKVSFELRGLEATGLFHRKLESASWTKFVPPAAKVKAKLDAGFDEAGELVAQPDAKISAGMFKGVSEEGYSGTIRGRILPNLPYSEDFESFDLSVPHKKEEGVRFAYPPLPWIGARFKWEVREVDGTKALAKTLDRVLFQRGITFVGHPDESNYTIQADVMSDGNRRSMSNGGIINQRYFISLIGNWQQLEVSSNHDRIKVGVPFKWKRNVWYTIKSRVDVAEDGSGIVRGKAWKRSDPEPSEWTIEVPHKVAHTKGAPGIIGFSPQSKFRVYVDNISITPND